MKSHILKRLRSSKETVSGEILRTELNTSRVTVWNHIQKLQELGYDIRSAGKGYTLHSSPDIPYPWEFPGREDRIHYHPELVSTMDAARELGRKNCPRFTAVIAGRQTGGRGRLQRQWFSDEGGLYFTVVVRPNIPPLLASRVNFAASLTMALVLREMFGIDAGVKWPNDILVNEKKIMGMLSEMETDADMVSFVSIGMGINVNNDPTVSEPSAVSMKQLVGHEVSKKELLMAFLDAFEKRMDALDYDRIVEEWKKYTITIGRDVRIVTTQDVCEGRAADVDRDGSLILETADGSKKRVIYGDCFHQNS
ncbi:MAG: biotin--[acetyl-CoA-carboxylase] ligase [Desulfococcaceae bacterium]|jgi:BirA family biotin operon repressor/biotin-[acetyl-CoA-carboxylase] ligase|nr:biotin--[acetyl-CoA-carboxylase] ligase [Desulfococcaceae bacterium]